MLLGLDASVGAGAALIDGERIVGSAVAGPGARPAAELVPLIAAALSAAAVKRTAVDALAVGVGPGSYAGVRAAVATAKAWAWACGLPLVAVDSLRALALASGPGPGALWAVLDARNGHVFAARYGFAADGLPREAVPGRHMVGTELAATIAGEEVAVRVAGADGPWVGTARFAAGAVGDIASAVARLGMAQLRAGDVADPLGLVPRYLRPPQVGRPEA